VGEVPKIKALDWIGSSRKDLKEFPAEVRNAMGYASYQAQLGLKASQKAGRRFKPPNASGWIRQKISQLMRGGLTGFSADRLFAILNRLGYNVEVRISTKEQSPEKTRTRVMIA